MATPVIDKVLPFEQNSKGTPLYGSESTDGENYYGGFCYTVILTDRYQRI